MDFAFIAPVAELNRISSLSPLRMCLAHLLVNGPYRYYFAHQSEGATLILDNGCFELGEPVSDDALISYYSSLSPHFPEVVVLPDVTTTDSLTVFREAIETCVPAIRKMNPAVKFMAVPHQWTNYVELVMDIRNMLDVGEDNVDYIGLVKDVDLLLPGGRAEVIATYLESGEHPLGFHALGCRISPYEEIKAMYTFGVADKVLGMDSSLPYRLGASGRPVSKSSPYPPVLDFFAPPLSLPRLNYCEEQLVEFRDWMVSLDS